MQSGKRLNSDKDWQYSLIGPVADANGTLFMITGDNEEFGLTMYFTVIEPVTSTILAKYLMSDQNFGLMGMGSITPDGRYVNVYVGFFHFCCLMCARHAVNLPKHTRSSSFLLGLLS
eukprot:TRINITY_DN460_c0_g1_i8.p2 TRINITY_DN460_c0_g1~~TRINITY_DN460_c0_g1_i8.p2  ORF type:complete len:117 (-),score=17.89 TRINITY_DN460_c0_g1_i8:13-363(-)